MDNEMASPYIKINHCWAKANSCFEVFVLLFSPSSISLYLLSYVFLDSYLPPTHPVCFSPDVSISSPECLYKAISYKILPSLSGLFRAYFLF